MPNTGVDPDRLPTHIAIVMDGNGRWANLQGLPRSAGHDAGEQAIFATVDACLEIGIRWLTVYAFSTENWKRPPDEVSFLINLNDDVLNRRKKEMNEKGVRLRFAGDRDDWRMPKSLIRNMEDATDLTKGNDKLTFTVAFNYGGRAEIVKAVQGLVDDGITKVDEQSIASRLFFPDMPDPDLMIRTSGESRISNFLLWELAYSEFLFMDVLWPDFSKDHLIEAICEYQHRDRRYGGVKDTDTEVPAPAGAD